MAEIHNLILKVKEGMYQFNLEAEEEVSGKGLQIGGSLWPPRLSRLVVMGRG